MTIQQGLDWYKIFELAPQIVGPFQLLALALIALTWLVCFIDIDKRAKGALLLILAVGISFSMYRAVVLSLEDIQGKSLVPLEKGSRPTEISPGILVSLSDVESLEVKNKPSSTDPSGLAYNCYKDKETLNKPQIVNKILKMAGSNKRYSDICSMSQKEWEDYVNGMEKNDVLKDTPFVSLDINVNGKQVFPGIWWTKSDIILINSGSVKSIAFENIYNIKDRSSGERETVNIRVFPM